MKGDQIKSNQNHSPNCGPKTNHSRNSQIMWPDVMLAVKATAPAIKSQWKSFWRKGKLSEESSCASTVTFQLIGQLAPSPCCLEVRGKLAIWLGTHPHTAGYCTPVCAEVAFSLLNRRQADPQRSFKVHTNQNGRETEEDFRDKRITALMSTVKSDRNKATKRPTVCVRTPKANTNSNITVPFGGIISSGTNLTI